MPRHYDLWKNWMTTTRYKVARGHTPTQYHTKVNRVMPTSDFHRSNLLGKVLYISDRFGFLWGQVDALRRLSPPPVGTRWLVNWHSQGGRDPGCIKFSQYAYFLGKWSKNSSMVLIKCRTEQQFSVSGHFIQCLDHNKSTCTSTVKVGSKYSSWLPAWGCKCIFFSRSELWSWMWFSEHFPWQRKMASCADNYNSIDSITALRITRTLSVPS